MSLDLITNAQKHQPNSLKALFEHLIPETERRCMESLDTAAALLELSALQEKKVLINCHLTLSTLMMMDILIKAGATVFVTRANDLVCHEDILEQLKNCNLYIPFADIEQPAYKSFFDLVLDSGGYLANILKPKAGFIELTQVENKRYMDTTSPVISVDASFIKYIETSLGTGDGFMRAIRKIYLQQQQDFTEKTYLIFGYGKVGKGIAHCLTQSGVHKKQITIVDVRDNAVCSARTTGFTAYNIVNQHGAIRALLPNIDCAVTATGISGTISRYFTAKDFKEVPMLANMGTYDEWGRQFPTARILHHKKPLNYILEFPTRVCYLDPIYALMITASAHAINKKTEDHFRVSKPPKKLQQRVLDQWFKPEHMIDAWQVVEKFAGTTFEMA